MTPLLLLGFRLIRGQLVERQLSRRYRAHAALFDRGRLLFGRKAAVLDLGGREVDLESLAQEAAHLPQHAVAFRHAAHPDMASENIDARRQAPCVDVVDVGDALQFTNRGDRGVQIEILGRALQEDVESVFRDPP